jgi:TatD DNase family protein
VATNACQRQGTRKKFIKSLSIPKLAAIGEAGLDRLIQVDINTQLAVFSMQADLAAEIDLPLIIHAVRSYPDLIRLRKAISKTSVWIVHGFSGNSQSASELIKHGMMLSFGHSILNSKNKAQQTIKEVPLDSLFLETDSSGIAISVIYQQAASLLNMDVIDLQHVIKINFKRCFQF